MFTALFMLLCACASPAGPQPANIPPEDEQAGREPEPSAITELVFSISRDADRELVLAAEYFCRGFAEIMGGAVTARVEAVIAPDADLISGKAQAAFLNKKRQLNFNPALAATATPFIYSSYPSFTIRANARSTLNLLRGSMRSENGLIPLAAFYQGAQQMLTDFPAGAYQNFEYSFFAVSEATDTGAVLERLGVDIIEGDDDERMEFLLDARVNGLEISLEALSQAELLENLYLTLSYHSIVPVWLVVGADFFDSLTPVQQAGVWELCAVMINMIDDGQVAREKALLAELAERDGLIVLGEFSGVRNRVFHTMPSLGEGATPQQRLAYELADLMRRI